MTLKNGTITLANPSRGGLNSTLFVGGTNIELEDITIIGGSVGLCVMPGSTVTLRNCTILDANIGVWVGSTNLAPTRAVKESTKPSKLDAWDLKISDCGQGGAFCIGGGGTAMLTDCNFGRGRGHGVVVSGDGPSNLTAKRLVCIGNAKKGMIVQSGAVAELISCSLMANEQGSLIVRGTGSRAILSACSLDDEAMQCQGGELKIMR